MQYDHTQNGGLHLLLHAASVIMLAGAWLSRGEPALCIILLATGASVLALAFAFHHLSIRDEVDCLAIRYGPLPLFRKRIRYEQITAVAADRSSFLDGWGIHYVPGRGWTYNLWGFDCVKLTLGRKVIRVGTDDVDNLVAFLRARTRLSD